MIFLLSFVVRAALLAAVADRRMFAERQSRLPAGKSMEGITTVGQATYLYKFNADFSMELRRSVREILKEWMK